jgi:hypothetical protein
VTRGAWARIGALLLLTLSAAPVPCLDWPVQKRIVTGTFGEDRVDHFHNGIDIGGGDQDVHPVLDGELVFRYDENQDYTSLPRGVGSFVVLHHGQDVLSAYCHLARGSLGPVRASFTPLDRIGIVGDTGHSDGKHLHFSVFDEQTKAFVNPLALLPPQADAQPPVIRRVLLAVGDQLLPLRDGIEVRAGIGEILVEAYDLREDVKFHWPLAPYRVRLALDGKEAARISFDSLAVADGRTVLGGTALWRDLVYGPEDLLRCGSVDLRPGNSRLLIAVRDFAGNETLREIALTVR